MRCHSRCLSLVFALLTAIGRASAAEDAISVEKAWELLPHYQYGQDIAALLVIDQQVISAMASPDARAACAARLAGILETSGTTPAARQYVCMQLRQVGTPAQVPVLARLLENAESAEDARLALEAIPGEQALQAMREALQDLSGRSLIGTINSLAARRDAGAVSTLQQFAAGNDPQAANAALWALGNIANAQAANFLLERAKNVQVPTPMELAVPLLRCAEAETESSAGAALSIYTYLSQSGQPAGVRRAAMEGMLRLAEDRPAIVQKWFAGDDADWRLIAAGHLPELSEQQLDELVERLADLPEASQFALLEFMAPRRGQGLLPMAMKLAGSDRPELRAAGLRCLGMLGDSSTIPLLVDALAAGGVVTEVAQQSLSRLPRPEVGAALLTALEKRAAMRTPVIEVLTELKYYEAIDPLIRLAASPDAAVYEPALNGLRGIADPDEHDVPRLVTLLLRTPAGRHRDDVERTITVVCEKLPAGSDRAELVLAALGQNQSAEATQYLPLLGRLGGPKAREIIDNSLASDQPSVRQAAVRALCNWPTAEVAGQLWALASSPGNNPQRQSALRAYVRVVSLPSERPEAETLAMLQKAMDLAVSAEDKRLIINRASNVRTIETVAWLAPFLDDADLDQAACLALVELAHHRFLRHPNMDRFGPLLEKVGRVSRDAQVRERANKYRLGL